MRDPARRGKSDRTNALREALLAAQERFCLQWDRQPASTFTVTARRSWQSAGLQAVDYFLWALQRVYERGEDRYVRFIWPSVGLVHDVDDRGTAKYGTYYNKARPLTAASTKEAHGI